MERKHLFDKISLLQISLLYFCFLCHKQFRFVTLTSVPPGRYSGMRIVIQQEHQHSLPVHPWFSRRDTDLSYWINLFFPTFLYCLEQLTNFYPCFFKTPTGIGDLAGFPGGNFFLSKQQHLTWNQFSVGIRNSFAETSSALYPTSGMTHDACEFAGSCGNKYHYIFAAPFHSAFGPAGISLCQQTQVAIVKEHD